MKHTGLIQCIIEVVVLDDGMLKGKFMPSEDKPLIKYDNGELTSGMFSYISVVGMLLYLSGNTSPDVFLGVNTCT